MSNLSLIKTYQVEGGAEVRETCVEACRLAREEDAIIRFEFNGIPLEAFSFSEPANLMKQWESGLKSRVEKNTDKKEIEQIPLSGILVNLVQGCFESVHRLSASEMGVVDVAERRVRQWAENERAKQVAEFVKDCESTLERIDRMITKEGQYNYNLTSAKIEIEYMMFKYKEKIKC